MVTIESAISWFEKRMECTAMPGARSMFAMALSALREQEERRWIPVTERLPGNDDFVLVIVCGKSGCITLENAIELAQFSMDEGWILEMWQELEDPKVTYWTPLPEPPEAEATLEVHKGGDDK